MRWRSASRKRVSLREVIVLKIVVTDARVDAVTADLTTQTGELLRDVDSRTSRPVGKHSVAVYFVRSTFNHVMIRDPRP
jgi:hypothetical protein